MKVLVTKRITGYYTVEVDVNTLEEALTTSEQIFSDADFGELYDIESVDVTIEDENERILWKEGQCY